jgi:hypothetical protein
MTRARKKDEGEQKALGLSYVNNFYHLLCGTWYDEYVCAFLSRYTIPCTGRLVNLDIKG